MTKSIIIPSHSSGNWILECINAIINQDKNNIVSEIIIVDTSLNHKPGNIDMFGQRVKWLMPEHRLTAGEARNIGIRHTRGDILIFLDSDCIVDKNWLRFIGHEHKNGYDVVVGSICNARSTIVNLAEYYLQFIRYADCSKKRKIDTIIGGNFSAKRHVFENVGLFSDIKTSEDEMLGAQIMGSGIEIIFNPAIKAWHYGYRSFMDYIRYQYVLGRHGSIARKKEFIRGYYFARIPFIWIFLPIARTINCLEVIFRLNHRACLWNLIKFLCIFPVYFLGLAVWTAGFRKGMTDR